MPPSFPIPSSSSRGSSSFAKSSSRPLISDVFKPRLPRDPFVEIHEPWALKIDDVVSATNARCRRDVLLVLGVPSLRDLEPFLQSQYLETSLLIIATHQPPNISAALPAIHILRLSTPLAIEDAGAVRFVNILECAERIARVWRKAGGKGIQESSEADMDITSGSASLPAPIVFRFASESTPSSPQLSNERLATPEKSPAQRRHRSRTLSFTKSLAVPLPPADIFQRPFDSILNYLPSGVSDKALLKQSILVTTISRPFLTALSDPAHQNSNPGNSAPSSTNRRRRSKGLSQSSIYSAPVTPSNRSRASLFSSLHSPSNSSSTTPPVAGPPCRAHLVHLIPPTRQPTISRAKLMQSMESFLCSFAYPSPLGIGKSSDSASVDRAVPYLLHPYALRGLVQHALPTTTAEEESVVLEWTIAELLLSGALDHSVNKGQMGSKSAVPRAWISSPNDVIFAPTSRRESMASVNLPQPLSPTVRERERQREGGAFVWNGNGNGNSAEGTGSGSGSVSGSGSPGTDYSSSGMGSPSEASPPPTPATTVSLNSNSLSPPPEKAFRVPLPFRNVSGEKIAIPTTPTTAESDESDSSAASTREDGKVIVSTEDELVVKIVGGGGGGSKAKFRQFLKQGKRYSKWKFWKVSFATSPSSA